MHNAGESFEPQQLSPNTTTGDVFELRDPFAEVRLARLDYGANPFTFTGPFAPSTSPFNLNITNPYGPRFNNQYQDQSDQFDQSEQSEDDDGIDFSDGPVGPDASDRPQYERPEDQRRPIVTVRQGESIQRAIDKAPENAIIKVEAGVYKEAIKFNRDNITLRGEKGAIMDFSGVDASGGAIKIENRQNITIAGFEIKNIQGKNTPTAIQIEGTSKNIRILDNNIHQVENNSNAHAIAVYGRKSTPIQNIEIAGNKIHDLRLGSSEAVVINGNVDKFQITDNQIYNSNNIAIDIIGGERVSSGNDRARNGLIARNDISNISSKSNPAYRGNRSAAGIYVDGGTDIEIVNNRVQNSDYGIEIASERKGMNAERIKVRNNELTSNFLAGISLGGGSSSNGGITDSIIENNRLSRNTRAIWRQNNISAVQIRDNIESS